MIRQSHIMANTDHHFFLTFLVNHIMANTDHHFFWTFLVNQTSRYLGLALDGWIFAFSL